MQMPIETFLDSGHIANLGDSSDGDLFFQVSLGLRLTRHFCLDEQVGAVQRIWSSFYRSECGCVWFLGTANRDDEEQQRLSLTVVRATFNYKSQGRNL